MIDKILQRAINIGVLVLIILIIGTYVNHIINKPTRSTACSTTFSQ